ncbi:unnamed protein product, partial [Lymnaea stagnalis]
TSHLTVEAERLISLWRQNISFHCGGRMSHFTVEAEHLISLWRQNVSFHCARRTSHFKGLRMPIYQMIIFVNNLSGNSKSKSHSSSIQSLETVVWPMVMFNLAHQHHLSSNQSLETVLWPILKTELLMFNLAHQHHLSSNQSL